MKHLSKSSAGKWPCRNSYCTNTYGDVIGKHGGATKMRGAECIPCLYANQLLDQGQTPEMIEEHEHLMVMFSQLLEKTGWTWQQVKDAFHRAQGARPGAAA